MDIRSSIVHQAVCSVWCSRQDQMRGHYESKIGSDSRDPVRKLATISESRGGLYRYFNTDTIFSFWLERERMVEVSRG